jgi:hypothetical protein
LNAYERVEKTAKRIKKAAEKIQYIKSTISYAQIARIEDLRAT